MPYQRLKTPRCRSMSDPCFPIVMTHRCLVSCCPVPRGLVSGVLSPPLSAEDPEYLSGNTESASVPIQFSPPAGSIISKMSDLIASGNVSQRWMIVCKSASTELFSATAAPDSAPPVSEVSVSCGEFACRSSPTRGALHSGANFRSPLVDRKRRERPAFFRIPVHVKTFGDSLRRRQILWFETKHRVPYRNATFWNGARSKRTKTL